jgi:hypothetical protein
MYTYIYIYGIDYVNLWNMYCGYTGWHWMGMDQNKSKPCTSKIGCSQIDLWKLKKNASSVCFFLSYFKIKNDGSDGFEWFPIFD